MNQPDSAEIEAIAAREAKATPGPWIASHESVSDIHGFDCQSQVTYPDGQGNYGFAPADAEFIAHARQDIPTLLAALASEKERADNAQETSRLTDQQLDYMRDRLAAAEQVIEAAERLHYDPDHRTYFGCNADEANALNIALANYHKATGPQAENHLDVELLRVHAEGFGNGGPVGKPEVTTAEESEHPTD